DDKGQTVSGAGAEGVTVNNDKAEFINENLIAVTGANSKGINISKGTATNKGTIEVANGGIGTYVNGSIIDEKNKKVTPTNSNFSNKKEIIVSGKNSKGINLNNGGKASNGGNITVSNEGIGVFFTATDDTNLNPKIELSEFENTKDGKISVSGANSKGIYLNAKGNATNNGEINLFGGALAVYNKGGNVINNGKISGVGTGVKLDNGYFINSGEITTTGSAIESVTGTNNTVYLKEGSKIDGKILGNTGIDVLAINGKQSNLNIDKYEAIVVRGGDTTITDSTIALEYNKGTKKYLEESKNKLDTLEKLNKVQDSSGNLTMENSKLTINFKDSLTNPNATENPIIDAGKLTFTGKTNLVFNSSDGRNEFNVNEALGLEGKKLDLSNAELDKTAVWDYQVNKNGNLVAKKENYQNVVTKGELKDFATVFDKNRSNMSGDLFNKVVKELDTLKTSGEFTQAMAQMSGGIHGYTVDISAINSRTLVNTMRNRALNGEYISNRANNSWTQDVVYLDSNHKMNGLMSASYDERGILGITEKQVYPNSRLGFVYGGSRGDAEFDNGISGNIRSTNTYLGGYYNYDFNNNISLNSNFSFVYGHNKVNRKINIGNYSEELKSNYPTYAMGIGTNVVYTLKDDQKNRALFYTGIDINRIMQGNINEKEELKIGDKNTTLMVKNASANEFSYYSITPNIGMTLQNSGYILDRKYLVGADFSWETEIGNIKDGKRLNMQGIPEQYKVGTVDRENVISASVFGQVELTESLAVNGKYTIARSDKYDTDLMSLGMSYKMDSLADNLIIGPVLQGIENTRSTSDRWMGTFSFMFENEDDSDRAYYHSTENYLTGGDYATSTKVTPKFILNLIDKQSNWSYYFEGYYMANDFLKETKENENKFSSTRIHGEARWRELYSKGQYGLNIGYRNETAEKPALSTYEKPQRLKEGVHQLRLTPNFTYNLGNGFKFEAKPTSIFKYNYEGIREGQMDFVVEGEYYLTYSGFMPSWNLRLGYYREDRWMDHSNRKLVWDSVAKDISEARDSRRYQLNQLRPSATYYFGNGDNVTLSLRLPLGNGAWYNSLDNNKKGAESYETRYSVDYNHVVVPGFNVFGGITFLDIKTKNKDHASKDYGRITKSYSFRPKLGFSYNF
ncbi:autotransporter domain-containing protein, partial [Fusobacterium sp.]|uniref:autotransporter family protein n=1 Tax=Fusobacterium sp. TaxID=68766 RepID=UPI0025B9165D